jgi:hypothetical protein
MERLIGHSSIGHLPRKMRPDVANLVTSFGERRFQNRPGTDGRSKQLYDLATLAINQLVSF